MADKEYPQGRTIHYSGGLEDSADKKKKDNYKRAATLMEQGKEGEAIDIFRKTLDLDPTISERAALFVLIGNCHVALGEMDQAASRYRGAESSAKQARDTEGAAAVTANLGLINHVRVWWFGCIDWLQTVYSNHFFYRSYLQQSMHQVTVDLQRSECSVSSRHS